MPSHEPLGNSFARLLKKSGITAQTAVLVVTGIVITLFSFFPFQLNSHCSFLFFLLFQHHTVSYSGFFFFLLLLLVSVLVFLVFSTTATPHVQSITLGRRGRKYGKLKVKRVALLSTVSCLNTFLLSVASHCIYNIIAILFSGHYRNVVLFSNKFF